MPLAALPIESERLRLRLVETDDLPALLRIHAVDEVTRFLPYTTWTGIADAQAWYARAVARHEDGSALQFVIVEKATGEVVGTSLLFRFDTDSARAEVGYALGRPHWGRGFMHEALGALIGFAFGTLALRRLEAEVDPRNLASDRVLIRLGFTREGLLRQRWVAKGEAKDTHIYGLLRGEWSS
ncbi:GNAT family N-acetyltransferase [Piscinibacter sp.]|uniref:GNAT family N-acetyltransferase n=1 Tax=Piscinibacter sp. TaxID=1903157 RepID=UPI002C8104D4|nr:GNAT family N-acetyltransferase [Albitalea sp.]HUG24376.1 GNAT family N-acetyltransferase [Albitalea sp.]